MALEYQSTTVKRFIDAVKINSRIIEIIAESVGSNDRHHYPTDENISMKFLCSITAEKNTLSNMTQEWIWSEVMPPMRQYRTDLLSQDFF